MKKLFTAFLLLTCFAASSQTLVMNDETSDVSYTAKHLAAKLEGTFKGVDGKASFNPQQLNKAYLRFKFASNTMTSNETFFTPDLVKKSCFNSTQYPFIELSSTSITQVHDSLFNFKGTLKVKGISKPVSFRFSATANVGGYDFKFNFPIIRKQYDLNCIGMGKELRIKVSSYAKRM